MSLKSGNYRKNLETISIDIVSVKSKAEDAVLEFVDLSAQVQDLSAEFQDLSAQVNSVPVFQNIQTLTRNYDYTSTNNEEELYDTISFLKGNYVIQIENRIILSPIGDNLIESFNYSLYESGTDNRLGRVVKKVNVLPSELSVVYTNDIIVMTLDSDMDVDIKVAFNGGLQGGGSFRFGMVFVMLKM